MGYSIGSKKITMTCKTCSNTMSMDISGSQYETMRALWAKASKAGWTSTSENHFCKRCSSGR